MKHSKMSNRVDRSEARYKTLFKSLTRERLGENEDTDSSGMVNLSDRVYIELSTAATSATLLFRVEELSPFSFAKLPGVL